MILLQPVSKISRTDLLTAYLQHGSLQAVPGLIDPAKLTYDYFDKHVPDRSGEPRGSELFCLHIESESEADDDVCGAELKFRFHEGALYSDSIRVYGEPIDVCEFLDVFFLRVSKLNESVASGFNFDVFLFEGPLDEGAVIFRNGRVVRFDVRGARESFVVHSIDGDYAQGWERTAEANLDSIRTILRPLDLIVDEVPRVLGFKRSIAALKAKHAYLGASTNRSGHPERIEPRRS